MLMHKKRHPPAPLLLFSKLQPLTRNVSSRNKHDHACFDFFICFSMQRLCYTMKVSKISGAEVRLCWKIPSPMAVKSFWPSITEMRNWICQIVVGGNGRRSGGIGWSLRNILWTQQWNFLQRIPRQSGHSYPISTRFPPAAVTRSARLWNGCAVKKSPVTSFFPATGDFACRRRTGTSFANL